MVSLKPMRREGMDSYHDEEGRKGIKAMTRAFIVGRSQRLPNNSENLGDERLERFL
jgi:hypothetical protein